MEDEEIRLCKLIHSRCSVGAIRALLPLPAKSLAYAANSAASDGHCGVLAMLLDEVGLAVDFAPFGDHTLLELAVSDADVATVTFLLERGASPNVGDPLMNAVYRGSLPIVRLLVEAGADVNRGNGVMTPLELAHTPEIREFLLAHGATEKAKRRARRRAHGKARPEPAATGAGNLHDALVAGLRLSWNGLREAHPNETFYFFGIYTTCECMYAQSMAGGEAALTKESLRWSPPDSAYLDEGSHFLAMRRRSSPSVPTETTVRQRPPFGRWRFERRFGRSMRKVSSARLATNSYSRSGGEIRATSVASPRQRC